MENKGLTNINDAAYQKLIDNITALWSESKAKAITASILNCLMPTGRQESILLNMNLKVRIEQSMASSYL